MKRILSETQFQEDRPTAKHHRHEFSSLYWHFGWFERQDVHVHSCRPWADDRCQCVLVGAGRECDGRPESHHRETL